MKKVLIIHGLNSSPNKAWRPWLMQELAKKDIYACALPMPGGETPNCEDWIETIKKEIGPKDEVYLVGHSLGARGVLRYLEKVTGNAIKGVVIVAGRFGKPESQGLESFYDKPLDFQKIKTACESFVVIHGDNDPNIPYDDAVKMAENLGCKLITIHGGGHLSGRAKWMELPEASDALFAMMEK